jgi:hypothetical protein
LNKFKALGLLALIAGLGFILLSIVHYSFETSNGILIQKPNLIDLIIWVVLSLLSFVLLWLSRFEIENHPEIPITVYEKCYSCDKELLPSVEQVELKKNISNDGVKLCKDCIMKELDKQDGICPECKKPLKWNGNLREFFGEWYHPKCVFDLQKGGTTKEVKETREVVVKFRCPYCKYVYDDSLDKCPHCGGKHA